MKRSRAQLNAISRAYSQEVKNEWYELSKKYPSQAKEINKKYTYARVKIKKLNEMVRGF